jgi:hypothetical protein
MTGLENLHIRQEAGGAIIAVRVVPGASRDKVVGILGDALKISTSAAAEKGRANAAVAAALAAALGVRRRDVTLVAGQTSRRKEFRVAGLTGEQVRAALRG